MAASKRRARSLPSSAPDIDAILDQLNILHIEAITSTLTANVQETMRHWLVPRGGDFDDPRHGITDVTLATAAILAGEVEMIKPSFSGKTGIDRLERKVGTVDGVTRAALAILKSARVTLMRVESARDADNFVATDLVKGGTLSLYNDRLPLGAVGHTLIARLGVLPDGRAWAVGATMPLDAAAAAIAMDFGRPGKGITNDHRCLAAVYRYVMRHGGATIPGYGLVGEEPLLDALNAADDDDTEADDVCHLAAAVTAWTAHDTDEGKRTAIADARRFASVALVLEAFYNAHVQHQRNVPEIAERYRILGEVQVETLHNRSLSGVGHGGMSVNDIASTIAREVAVSGYPREAAALFEAARKRILAAARPKADSDDLTRVVERIRGLRAKTIDQGCTEEEAIAAARKVAELLDRYGLSLSEIDIKSQACEGIAIETSRKRLGPLDECARSVAAFCDCRTWFEKSVDGSFRTFFFGLPADVEAARFLHERVENAFETESAAFRRGDLYADLPSGERRGATNAFQFGLARGIRDKLESLKQARDTAAKTLGGRDLVLTKKSILEDEMEKLGLNFTATGGRSNRRLRADAYQAGEVAGRQFEARRGLSGEGA